MSRMPLFDRESIHVRLSQLGLPPERILRSAVELGEMARAATSAHHPPAYPGFVAWGETLRGLADHVVAEGWRRIEWRGLSVVMDPQNRVAIAVTTGDENTSTADDPRSRYRKGLGTVLAVASNQLSLFEVPRNRHQRPEPTVWFLLIRSSRSSVAFELAQPTDMSEDGRLCGWEERLVFEPIVKRADDNGDPDHFGDEPPIDVPVDRRR